MNELKPTKNDQSILKKQTNLITLYATSETISNVDLCHRHSS